MSRRILVDTHGMSHLEERPDAFWTLCGVSIQPRRIAGTADVVTCLVCLGTPLTLGDVIRQQLGGKALK